MSDKGGEECICGEINARHCPIHNNKVIIDCGYKFPPKRTAREWREITKMKLRQYEAIAYTYLGKSPFNGSGE